MFDPVFGALLSQQATGVVSRIIECIDQGLCFVNDDHFEEHLDNPKSIKEILTDALTLSLLDPKPFLAFVTSSLAQ